LRRRTSFSYWLLVTGYWLLILNGCTYSAVSLLPAHIKKICIAGFENKSYRPDLPEKILQSVTREFIIDGRLVVCGEGEADALLFGEISRYDLQPLSYTEQMKVQEYKVRIVLSFWLKDVRENKVLWQENELENFITISSSTGGLEVELENDAIDEVVQKLSRRVVKRVIDGWT